MAAPLYPAPLPLDHKAVKAWKHRWVEHAQRQPEGPFASDDETVDYSDGEVAAMGYRKQLEADGWPTSLRLPQESPRKLASQQARLAIDRMRAEKDELLSYAAAHRATVRHTLEHSFPRGPLPSAGYLVRSRSFSDSGRSVASSASSGQAQLQALSAPEVTTPTFTYAYASGASGRRAAARRATVDAEPVWARDMEEAKLVSRALHSKDYMRAAARGHAPSPTRGSAAARAYELAVAAREAARDQAEAEAARAEEAALHAQSPREARAERARTAQLDGVRRKLRYFTVGGAEAGAEAWAPAEAGLRRVHARGRTNAAGASTAEEDSELEDMQHVPRYLLRQTLLLEPEGGLKPYVTAHVRAADDGTLQDARRYALAEADVLASRLRHPVLVRMQAQRVVAAAQAAESAKVRALSAGGGLPAYAHAAALASARAPAAAVAAAGAHTPEVLSDASEDELLAPVSWAPPRAAPPAARRRRTVAEVAVDSGSSDDEGGAAASPRALREAAVAELLQRRRTTSALVEAQAAIKSAARTMRAKALDTRRPWAAEAEVAEAEAAAAAVAKKLYASLGRSTWGSVVSVPSQPPTVRRATLGSLGGSPYEPLASPVRGRFLTEEYA